MRKKKCQPIEKECKKVCKTFKNFDDIVDELVEKIFFPSKTDRDI